MEVLVGPRVFECRVLERRTWKDTRRWLEVVVRVERGCMKWRLCPVPITGVNSWRTKSSEGRSSKNQVFRLLERSSKCILHSPRMKIGERLIMTQELKQLGNENKDPEIVGKIILDISIFLWNSLCNINTWITSSLNNWKFLN